MLKMEKLKLKQLKLVQEQQFVNKYSKAVKQRQNSNIFYFKMEKMEWDKLKVSQWVETVQTVTALESLNQV